MFGKPHGSVDFDFIFCVWIKICSLFPSIPRLFCCNFSQSPLIGPSCVSELLPNPGENLRHILVTFFKKKWNLWNFCDFWWFFVKKKRPVLIPNGIRFLLLFDHIKSQICSVFSFWVPKMEPTGSSKKSCLFSTKKSFFGDFSEIWKIFIFIEKYTIFWKPPR